MCEALPPTLEKTNHIVRHIGFFFTQWFLEHSLETCGLYFDTLGFHFGRFLELRARPVEPVGHFTSLSWRRSEKSPKWRSNSSSKWNSFRYIFNRGITLKVTFRELCEDWFLCVLFARSVVVRKAEYGLDLGLYCAKRTSHIWEQDRQFRFSALSGVSFGVDWIVLFVFF